MMPDTLYWREPLWLTVALLPFLFLLLRHLQHRRQLDRYVQRKLQPWVVVRQDTGNNHWRIGRIVLQLLAWISLAIAAAGPRLPLFIDPALAPQPGTVMLLIDLSRSMQADDVYPSRSALARRLPVSWLQDSPHEIAVIVFAGEAHLLLPPTRDKLALIDLFEAMRTLQLPAHGSQLDEALALAYRQLGNKTDNSAIFVISDGDMAQTTLASSLQMIQQAPTNIDLRILGIGSPTSSALADQSGQWLLQDGEVVTTRLNEQALQKLAQAGDGRYLRVDPDYPPTLASIWQAKPARLSDAQRQQTLWHELFGWFLLPAILLYLLSFFPHHWFSLMRKYFLLLLALLLPFFFTGQAQAVESEDPAQIYQRAWQAWANENYQAAATHFSQLPGYKARMGEGASCFRLQDIDCAISAFSKAAWKAANDSQRSAAAYNLGNSYFQRGDFASANTLFRDALRYDPRNQRIEKNLAFSEVVARAVAERLAQINAERNGRLGKGWRATNISPGSDLAPNTGVLLVEPKDEKNDASKESAEGISDLLEKGLRFARLSDSNTVSRSQQHGWVRTGSGQTEQASNASLWQRLIEMEKGLLTHPEQPRTLPGVLPW